MAQAGFERDSPEAINDPGSRDFEPGIRQSLPCHQRLGRFTLGESDLYPPDQMANFIAADLRYTLITLRLIDRLAKRQLHGVRVELVNIINT